MADENKDATQLKDGTVAAPSLAFTGDQDTGAYRSAADTLDFAAGGVRALQLSTASSAVNYLDVVPAAASSSPIIRAEGTDTNVGIALTAKAAGDVVVTTTGELYVGRQGATDAVLKVDAATASVATGISITGAAAASGVAVAAISSGTNENLTIDAKGSGTISLNNTGTGNIVLGRAATGVSLSVTAGYTARSGTAVPATASAVAALTLYSTGVVIEATSDAPTHTRPKGSICINTGGSSTSTRMYINTDAGTTWTNFTTAA